MKWKADLAAINPKVWVSNGLLAGAFYNQLCDHANKCAGCTCQCFRHAPVHVS